jgi:hypothetical protein
VVAYWDVVILTWSIDYYRRWQAAVHRLLEAELLALRMQLQDREIQPWFHGDCRVILSGGVTLTLSRRYPERLIPPSPPARRRTNDDPSG